MFPDSTCFHRAKTTGNHQCAAGEMRRDLERLHSKNLLHGDNEREWEQLVCHIFFVYLLLSSSRLIKIDQQWSTLYNIIQTWFFILFWSCMILFDFACFVLWFGMILYDFTIFFLSFYKILIFIYIYMFIYVYYCLYLFIYVYICLYMFIYFYIFLFIFIYIYIYLFRLLLVFLCIFIYVDICCLSGALFAP